jgi:NCS1 family nucleobase:cation symporter-1
VVYGLPVWAAIIAIAAGNVVGGVVMALHAAQGPQMGVPQMLQTRAQFGSQGSLLVVALVIVMYVGFFASNIVLGGQTLNSLFHWPVTPSIAAVGVISLAISIIGYKAIHTVAVFVSVIGIIAMTVFAVAFFAFTGLPYGTMSAGAFNWPGFMGMLCVGHYGRSPTFPTSRTTPATCPRTPASAARSGAPTPAACSARPCRW